MKKTLLATFILVISSIQANAVELKEGSLYCISSKKIIAYYDFLEKGREDFAQKLIDKADCFVKKRPEVVVLESEQKNYVELEMLAGFKIWTKKENIVR